MQFTGKVFAGERLVIDPARGETTFLTSGGIKGWGGYIMIPADMIVAEGQYRLVLDNGKEYEIQVHKLLESSVLFNGIGAYP